MKKNIPYFVVAASLLIAVISMASAAIRKKAATAEVVALQEQIVRMKAYVPEADAPIETIYTSEETNTVAALQALLAEKEAELAALKANSGSTTNQQKRQRKSFEERMAKMKAEDPEGYAEMIQRRQKRQEKMRYNLAERTATFMDLDTTHMSEAERANHELVVEKVANIWALTAQLQDAEEAPDREIMRELFSEIKEARPLMKVERTAMFKQLGTDLGYEGDDAQAFAEHVQNIITTTSLQMPRGGGRGGNRR